MHARNHNTNGALSLINAMSSHTYAITVVFSVLSSPRQENGKRQVLVMSELGC